MHPTYVKRAHRPARELRYRLSLILWAERRAMTTSELVAAVDAQGMPIPGRPSKTVADALRWEIRKGRVVRFRRASYGLGQIPESTVRYMRQQIDAAVERRMAA
jgi:hypothetical protein